MNIKKTPVILLIFHVIYMQTPGFYKDLFMDGGVHLTSRVTLPAADSLGFSFEYLATESIYVQDSIIIANMDDSNGRLLYPDGSPRYRTLYTNGGQSTSHGNSLGEEGRNRVRQFYNSGGSYTGSCAGAFIASMGYHHPNVHTAYYHLWPGWTEYTGLNDTPTGQTILPNSPLLNYFDFGGDLYIDGVYHNGGGYAREDISWPFQTEVLLRYDYPSLPMHEKVSTWAYKPDDIKGRIVVIMSHPESVTSGEQLHLMEAILHYAVDGIGAPQIKGELVSGETRYMNQSTEDSIPAFTKIGDKQYHHFTFSVPEEANSITIELDGEEGYDLFLYVTPDTFAFESNAQYMSNQSGSDQVLEIPVTSPGTWYIGVECATTIMTAGHVYFGDQSVLNGVAYNITASWDTTGLVTIAENQLTPDHYKLYQNYPNPFNPTTTIQYEIPYRSEVTITIYELRGNEVETLVSEVQGAGAKSVVWDASNVASGVYFYQIKTGDFIQTKRMVYLK